MGRESAARRRGLRQAEALWTALAAACAVALATTTGALTALEHGLYDQAVVRAAPHGLAGSDLVMIGIDDRSVAELGPWPWSRDLHARMIDQLATAGARTIAYTVPFDTLQTDRGLPYLRRINDLLVASGDASPMAQELKRLASEAFSALDSDAHLAASMQRAGTVLLASSYGPNGPPSVLPSTVRRSTLSDPGGFSTPVPSGRHPLAALASAAAGIGHTYWMTDDDGVLRSIPLVLQHDHAAVPSLALLTALHSQRRPVSDLRLAPALPGVYLGQVPVPTTTAAVWRPPWNTASMPTAVSFSDVLSGKAAASGFRDKTVLVGVTSPALQAPWQVPGGTSLSSVEVLAHAAAALGDGAGVVSNTAQVVMGWAAVAIMVAIAAGLFPLAGLAAAGGLAAGLIALLALAEWMLLRSLSQWVPMLGAAAALAGGWLGLALIRGFTRARPADSPTGNAEADRMMGLALQGQGQLDMAFERLRKVPSSAALHDNLYHLAQDFERQQQWRQAKEVYEHLLRQDRHFRDARSRYKRVRAVLEPNPATSGDSGPASPRLPGNAMPALPMLGRYRIDRELGKGAMGVVYAGRDPTIGRVVAIKTLALSHEFEGEALVDARARFFREAETAGRLQHPNIVTIFDAGEEHDLAYIAMEFLKGTDLTGACQPGRLLPIAQVLSIAARVADALDYAHAHQVVHRDIKPANIMYDAATDMVKVTDFGIARITDSSKTRTGLVLGTPSFMSPEQLAGKRVDGRSDLYSLGVTVFQLLTGSLPLRGESMTALMHKIATETPPDVRQLRPEVPAAVARVVAQALQKRPEHRQQTGRQLADDLRSAGASPASGDSGPKAESVVYDAVRNATGRDMADFQETVMEHPRPGDDASLPPAGKP